MLCFHRCFYSESHNLILGLESLFPSEFLKQTRSISSMRIANVMFAYYHFLLSENYLNTHIIRCLYAITEVLLNSDTLLTHIRLEQRCLIDIDKKLHELEYLLSSSDPIQFFEAAKNTALLSERSTAQLRNFLFTVCGGMPQDYYLQAAEMQGICVDVTDSILSVRLPALLPKKTRTEGFKFLQPALHAALKQYAEQQNLPHFRECTVCIEHVYDRCLPIKAVRDYDNLETKEVLDIITLYCMTDDTGALCDQFQTTRFADSSCTIISVMQKEKFSAWLDMKNPAKSVKS